MLIRRQVLISSSHIIFRRYTHFHIFSWDTFTFSRIWFVLCCLVVKCWHLGALPGLVESQYCFSFAASALLMSSSAEPEPISQFANSRSTESPFLQLINIGATGENAATKEGTPRFKIGVTVETMIYNAQVLAVSCFVKGMKWQGYSRRMVTMRTLNARLVRTKARHSRHIRPTLGEFLAALTKHFSRATIPLVPRRSTTN